MAAASAMFWLVDDHSRIGNVSSWQTLKLTAKPPSFSDDINTNECYYIIEDFELLWKRALNDRQCVVTSLSQDGWSFATLRIWLYKYPLKTADILRKLSRLLTEAKNLQSPNGSDEVWKSPTTNELKICKIQMGLMRFERLQRLVSLI